MNGDRCAEPRRTSGAVIHRPSGLESRWIVETPDGRTVRLGAEAGMLYACLDGVSSPDALVRRLGEPWTAASVNAGIARLRESGLIAESAATPGRTPGRFRAPSLASLQLTLLDHPAAFSGRRPWTTVVASTWSVAAGSSLGVIGLVVLLVSASQVLIDLSTPVAPWTTLALAALMVFLTSLHELGHAVALARYGGAVRRIGIMLFYLSPAMFCDVSDAWRLPDKRQRVMVALAGGVVSFALAGACAVFYALSPSNGALLAALAVASYAAVIFNLLPFVKFDGYIALMTHLDTPNLRRIAMDEWKRVLLGIIAGEHADHRVLKQRWAPWYGLSCSLMPLVLLGSVALQIGAAVAGVGVAGMLVRSAIWLSIGAVLVKGAWRIRELSLELGMSPWVRRAGMLTAGVCILGLSLAGVPMQVTTGYATLADGTSALIVPPGWSAEDLADRPVTLVQTGLLWQVRVGEGVAGSSSQYSAVPIQAMAPSLDYEGDLPPVLTLPLNHITTPEPRPAIGVARIHLGTTPVFVWAWRTVVGEPVRVFL